MTGNEVTSSGRVSIVGAGPGDPDLLTLKGWRCLEEADLIVADALVHPALLIWPPGEKQVVVLPCHAEAAQRAAVCRQMGEAARGGKKVVRLKGGDPGVFARLHEELDAFCRAGVPCEIIPGVTAASAAAALAGISLTDAARASAVALVTGHERREKKVPLDYAQLASFPGTLVFYMGIARAGEWSRALLAHGRAPKTPVAVVSRATTAGQLLIRCTLGELAERLEREPIAAPAVVIVGEVAGLVAADSSPRLPLAGVRVLVTRPEGQSAAMCQRLSALGAEVWHQPAIEISEPEDWQPLDDALRRIESFDWLVFSSPNGVRYFLERLLARGGDLRRLGPTRLAAIGPGTAAELRRYHLAADLLPEEFCAESLAAALIAAIPSAAPPRWPSLAESESSNTRAAPSPDRPVVAPRVLLIRASRGRDVLAERLRTAGIEVEQVVAYRSSDVAAPEPRNRAALEAGKIDWITVSSSAVARSLVKMFGPMLRRARLVSISPITSKTLAESGFSPDAEAAEYTPAGMVEAIVAAERRS